MIRFLQKLSTREIQVFVGGALAVEGFRALIPIPYFVLNFDLLRIGAQLIAALALPIGLGILMERPRALSFASLYLLLTVLAACLVIPVFYLAVPAKAVRVIKVVAPEVIINAVLFGLIFLSHSPKFRRRT